MTHSHVARLHVSDPPQDGHWLIYVLPQQPSVMADAESQIIDDFLNHLPVDHPSINRITPSTLLPLTHLMTMAEPITTTSPSPGPHPPPPSPPPAAFAPLSAFTDLLQRSEHIFATQEGSEEVAREALRITKSLFDHSSYSFFFQVLADLEDILTRFGL